MITYYNKQDLLLGIRVLGDDLLPITGKTGDDPLWSIGYRRPNSTWVDLSLVNGTLYTFADSSLVEDEGGDGIYWLGIPNSAKVAGERLLVRFKYGANNFDYDAIDYTMSPISGDGSGSDGIELEFNIPGSDIVFTSATSSSTLYTKETNRQVQFTANQNIEGETLRIIFEAADTVDKYVILDADITKSGDTATIDLPSGYTDEIGTLNWAVRRESDRRVYGIGTLAVTYAPYTDV